MAAERDVLIESNSKYGALSVGGNYQLVAKGLGVDSSRVNNPSDFNKALKKAMQITQGGNPYLIECMVKEGHEFSRDKVKDF